MVSKLVVTHLPALRATASSSSRSILPATRRLITTSSARLSPSPSHVAPTTLRIFNATRSAGLNTATLPLRFSTRAFGTTAVTMAQQAIFKGEQIPNTTFSYVPWSPELADGTACGAPTKIQTHEAFKGKKVVIVAVPGAYTPTCHVNHIPPYIKHAQDFKSKGVDQVIVLAQNDPFVMSAWGVQNKAEDKVIFATDLNLEFSKGIGSIADLSAMGFGERTGRYALVVDDLKVVDFSPETNPGAVEVSGAEHVLSKL